MPDTGPYRFFDPERRPVAKHVAYLLLKAAGFRSVPYAEIRLHLRVGLKGASLGHLKVYFESLGLQAVGIEESLKKFLLRDRPGVLATKSRIQGRGPDACRLILYRGLTPTGDLLITDPLAGATTVAEADLEKLYLGGALYLDGNVKRPILNDPDIAMDELVFSYGRVDAGTLIRHTFRIYNRGEKPLAIHGIRPSCGCLATAVHDLGDKTVNPPKGTFKRNAKTGKWEIDFEKMKTRAEVPPRGEKYVTGFYDSTNRHGRLPASITLFSSDPDEKEITLFVEGHVDPVAEFDPPVLYWRAIPSAEGAEAHMWMRSLRGKAFHIKAIFVHHPGVTVTEDPDAPREKNAVRPAPGRLKPRAHPASEGWRALKVKVKPGIKPGTFHAPVTLETDFSTRFLAFGAWGKITGNLEVDPSVAAFGRIPLGRQGFSTVRISTLSPVPLKVLKATTTLSRIMDVRVDEESPGVFLITLELKKGWQAPSLRGQIILQTNDPLEPLKTVDVSGFVQRGG